MGSRYRILFLDSASRLRQPYRTIDKSAPAIRVVVKRFVADMGIPRAFPTDNVFEYMMNQIFAKYSDDLGVR